MFTSGAYCYVSLRMTTLVMLDSKYAPFLKWAQILIFMPHGVAAERHRKANMGWSVPPRGLYTHHLQTEEDPRAGILRHHTTGGRPYGWTWKSRNESISWYSCPDRNKHGNSGMGITKKMNWKICMTSRKKCILEMHIYIYIILIIKRKYI